MVWRRAAELSSGKRNQDPRVDVHDVLGSPSAMTMFLPALLVATSTTCSALGFSDPLLVIAVDRPLDEINRLEAAASKWTEQVLNEKGFLILDRNDQFVLVAPLGLFNRKATESNLNLLRGLAQARLEQGVGDCDSLPEAVQELVRDKISESHSAKDIDTRGACFALIPQATITLEHEGKKIEIAVAPSGAGAAESALLASPVKGVDHSGFYLGAETPERAAARQALAARLEREQQEADKRQAERNWRLPSLAFKIVADRWVSYPERLSLFNECVDLVEKWYRRTVEQRERETAEILARLDLGEDSVFQGILGMSGDKGLLPDSVQKVLRDQLEAEAKNHGFDTPEKLEDFWSGARVASVRKSVYLTFSTGSVQGVGMMTRIQIAKSP
jgi:hypothetical protein